MRKSTSNHRRSYGGTPPRHGRIQRTRSHPPGAHDPNEQIFAVIRDSAGIGREVGAARGEAFDLLSAGELHALDRPMHLVFGRVAVDRAGDPRQILSPSGEVALTVGNRGQNGELVGTLERPSMWSAIFIATTAGAKWIFRRSGFWRAGIEIVEAGSEQPIAVFKGTWTNRGVLRFSDGQTLTVECKGFCHPIWTLRAQTGEAALWLQAREKIAEVDSTAMLPDRRLRLLVLFMLHRLGQAEEDAAAVAVAAAAS